MPGYFSVKKHDRENRRDQRRAEKLARRRERRMRTGSDRSPSAYPEAPEAYDGIARTLSRGLPE